MGSISFGSSFVMGMPEFRWGRIPLEVPENGFHVPYATFVADEYYFLDVGPNDVVIDAGAYVGASPSRRRGAPSS